jgi:DNA-binding transcriptional LysR family regulator
MRSGVVLSDAGRAFLPHAEALQAQLQDGIEAVHALRGASHGTVTLAIVGTLASTSLTDCLRRFRVAYPTVDLRVRTALSAETSGLVRRGEATLGLRYERERDPELSSTTIHEEHLIPVCAPDHHLARQRSVRPEALTGQRWIAFPPRPGAGHEPYASAFEQRLAICGLDASEIIPIDSLTAQKRMVEAGFGLALLPASSIDEELRTGTLHALRIPALRATIPVVLIQRRRAFHSGATKALLAILAAWPAQASPGSPPRRRARAHGAGPPSRRAPRHSARDLVDRTASG